MLIAHINFRFTIYSREARQPQEENRNIKRIKETAHAPYLFEAVSAAYITAYHNVELDQKNNLSFWLKTTRRGYERQLCVVAEQKTEITKALAVGDLLPRRAT